MDDTTPPSPIAPSPEAPLGIPLSGRVAGGSVLQLSRPLPLLQVQSPDCHTARMEVNCSLPPPAPHVTGGLSRSTSPSPSPTTSSEPASCWSDCRGVSTAERCLLPSSLRCRRYGSQAMAWLITTSMMKLLLMVQVLQSEFLNAVREVYEHIYETVDVEGLLPSSTQPHDASPGSPDIRASATAKATVAAFAASEGHAHPRVVELPKTEEGLGFNVMGGKEQNSPIYISRIIPGKPCVLG